MKLKRQFSSVNFYVGDQGQFVVIVNMLNDNNCIITDYGYKTKDQAKSAFNKYLFVFCKLGNKKAYKLSKDAKVKSLTGMTPILSIR